MNRIIELYSSIVACSNTAAECPNTINDPSTGNLPRGFYTQAENPDDVVLLLVAKNPGHPFEKEISGLYRDMTPAEQVRQHLDLQQTIIDPPPDLIKANGGSLTFSRNLRCYMGIFLGMKPNEIFKKCAYTNLVKCTTHGEQDKLDKQAIHECLNRHLFRELALYRNAKVLIAFGREVEKALKEVEAKHGEPIVYVKHPSYHYRKERKDEILTELKGKIASYL